MATPFAAALLFASAILPTRGAAFTPAADWVALGPPVNPMVSPLALASRGITGFVEPEREKKDRSSKKPRRVRAVQSNEGLGPERARILLRSLTVPGWGQATLGHRGSARTFLVVETGIWGAFTAFRIQQAQRTESYLLTARLDAGVDLRGRDDKFRSIVGSFESSEEYNQLVVTRDAANLYLSDVGHEDFVGYRAYVAQHSITGALSWRWTDEQSFRRYGGQRKFAQKAGLRVDTALALAIANRLVSALHAARQAGRAGEATPQGWRLDVRPGLDEPGHFRAALTTRF